MLFTDTGDYYWSAEGVIRHTGNICDLSDQVTLSCLKFVYAVFYGHYTLHNFTLWLVHLKICRANLQYSSSVYWVHSVVCTYDIDLAVKYTASGFCGQYLNQPWENPSTELISWCPILVHPGKYSTTRCNFNILTIFTGMGIPSIKIRHSRDHDK